MKHIECNMIGMLSQPHSRLGRYERTKYYLNSYDDLFFSLSSGNSVEVGRKEISQLLEEDDGWHDGARSSSMFW